MTLVKHSLIFLKRLSLAEGIAPLALRLYLAPVMLQSGWNKFIGFEGTVNWFEHSLSLPFPVLMASLAVGTELIGGILLVIGLGVRLVSVPLMVVMLVAAFMVHWDNGWLVLSDASSWLANDRVADAVEKKAKALSILREHGNYQWLTSSGPITILNNGIEFAITYFVMLLSLFFTGGGRYTSVDYWLRGRLQVSDVATPKPTPSNPNASQLQYRSTVKDEPFDSEWA